jgi:hypothetical protein
MNLDLRKLVKIGRQSRKFGISVRDSTDVFLALSRVSDEDLDLFEAAFPLSRQPIYAIPSDVEPQEPLSPAPVPPDPEETEPLEPATHGRGRKGGTR